MYIACASENACFPSYILANSVTIATDILNFGDSYLSRRAAKTCRRHTSELKNKFLIPISVLLITVPPQQLSGVGRV
jgi:hypothetical protein